MRNLRLNKQKIYYALYTGETETVVAGKYTGERTKTYGNPVEMCANVSPARGTVDEEIFGTDLAYSKTIVTEDTNCPINEYSHLWIGKTPAGGEHNYAVVRVAKSINNIAYAVDEVKVSGGTQSN